MDFIGSLLFYFFILFLLLLFSIPRNGNNKRYKLFAFLSFCILLFFYTFRAYSVGWDTIPYVDIYTRVSQINVAEFYMEPGWIYLNKLLYGISHSPHMLFLGAGILGIGSFFFVAKRISYNFPLSVILYYTLCQWFNLMNQVRCQIAICICMISFYCFYKYKYKLSFLFIIIAFFIHNSSVVFIPFLIFVYYFKELTGKVYALILIVVSALFVLFDYIYEFLTLYFFASYATESSLIRHTKGGNLKIFIFVFVIWLIISYIDHKYRNQSYSNMLMKENGTNIIRLHNMLKIAIIFSMCLQLISINNTMIARFANFFTIYLVILIPNTLVQISNPVERIIYKFVFMIITVTYMVISLAFSENGFGRDGVMPYILDF